VANPSRRKDAKPLIQKKQSVIDGIYLKRGGEGEGEEGGDDKAKYKQTT
jgi:hypothetical protein